MVPIASSDIAILGRYTHEGWFWDTRNNKVFKRVIHYMGHKHNATPYIVYKGETYLTGRMQLYTRER